MRFQRYIVSLKVTNDTAERAVHLVDQFAQTITDDDDVQWLIYKAWRNRITERDAQTSKQNSEQL